MTTNFFTADLYAISSVDGSGERRLTDQPLADFDPVYSPDGKRIAFVSERDGNIDLYAMNADGTGVARVTDTPGSERRPDFSPDGARLVFQRQEATLDRNIYSIGVDGSSERTLAAEQLVDEVDPVYSPDGSKIAFARDPEGVGGGSAEIYTLEADGSGARRTGRGGRFPDWQPVKQTLPAPGSIAGKVTRAKTKQAIEGARVDCGAGGSATTAIDGSYRIASVPPSAYTCTASATGYRPTSQTVTVTAGKEATANFALSTG